MVESKCMYARPSLVFLLGVISALFAQNPGNAPIQAPRQAAPQAQAPTKQPLVHPIFENERVRVIEVVWEPGAATAPARLAEGDTIGVVIRGGTIEHTYASGKRVRRERQPGEVLWQPGNVTLEARQNVGQTKINVIQVRLKKAPPSHGYGGPVPRVKKLLENTRAAVFDQTIALRAKLPPHKYAPRLWVILDGGDLRSWDKAGKQQDARVRASQVMWLPEQEHAIENVGQTPVRLISIEFK